MRWYKPDSANHRTCRWRANQLLKSQEVCELESIGYCSSGRFEVHHKDANPVNNELGNLMRLCPAHHKLVERGRIDLANPVMAPFFVSSGKRRYDYFVKEKEQMPPKVKTLKCQRCSHQWTPRSFTVYPKCCAKCKSRIWRQPRGPLVMQKTRRA
jgi:hypothetical protein